MTQTAFSVVADPLLVGTGTVVRITADHQPVYSFPPAVLAADLGFSFFQSEDQVRYSQQRTFGHGRHRWVCRGGQLDVLGGGPALLVRDQGRHF